MKHIYKIIIAVVLIGCALPAVAQQPLDTVQPFDLRYYRNCYDLHDDNLVRYDIDSGSFLNIEALYAIDAQRIAYRFIADSTLHIIGVAGAMDVFFHVYGPRDYTEDLANWTNAPIRIDSVIQLRTTEWFEVYQARTDDSLELLASVPWTLADSSVYVRIPSYLAGSPDGVFPIIECYFNKDITVHDSFYVGYTNFNHGLSYNDTAIVDDWTYLLWVPLSTVPYTYFVQQPGFSISIPPQDSCHAVGLSSGTAARIVFQWATSETNFYEPWQEMSHNPSYSPERMDILFPIIDTTGFDFGSLHDTATCDTVESFRVLDQTENHASFAWMPGQGATAWQLSWGPEGTAPGGGTVQTARTNVCTVSGMQEGTRYVAYVRAQCNDTLYGDWSSPLPFWMGMATTASPAPIDTYTYLIPNPASGKVTVASSFHMSRVELFSLDGRQLLTSQANTLAMELDISSLPAATYMVRITTPAGIAVKKLVVK